MTQPSLRARALRLLARREHSRRELERKLAGETADADAIASLLDDFERCGWLSETRVTEHHLARARGRYGPRRVLNDLKEKGISGDALAQATDRLKRSELENATEVWRKRFGKRPEDLKEKARQARFLAGRGFCGEVIRAVLGADPDEA